MYIRDLSCYALLLVFIMLMEEAKAESKFKIAIIDTGLRVTEGIKPYLCKTGHTNIIGSSWNKDHFGHGTNIAGLIANNLDPKKHCLVIIKVFGYKMRSYRTNQPLTYPIQLGDTEEFIEGIVEAVRLKVDMINLSVSGGGFHADEQKILFKAIKLGIHVVISSGNKSIDFDEKGCISYPVCYNYGKTNYIHIVGSSTKGKRGRSYSNTGSVVKYWEDGTDKGKPVMTGTSQAAAIYSGKLAKKLR